MVTLALLLLAVVPVAAWRYARAHAPSHIWVLSGAAFGFVVSPLSMGLYSTFFIGPLFPPGLLTGLLGLLSGFFHGTPGYEAAIWFGLIPPNKVVSGPDHIYIEVLNGAFWAVVYGLLGFFVDRVRSRVHESS
jgi:hypothetical protein